MSQSLHHVGEIFPPTTSLANVLGGGGGVRGPNVGGRIDTAAGAINRDVRGAGVGPLPELARRRQVVSEGVAA